MTRVLLALRERILPSGRHSNASAVEPLPSLPESIRKRRSQRPRRPVKIDENLVMPFKG